MFNFFGKEKQTSTAVIDKIWLSQVNKWKACIDQVAKEKDTIFTVWFEATYRQIETIFINNAVPADKIS